MNSVSWSLLSFPSCVKEVCECCMYVFVGAGKGALFLTSHPLLLPSFVPSLVYQNTSVHLHTYAHMHKQTGDRGEGYYQQTSMLLRCTKWTSIRYKHLFTLHEMMKTPLSCSNSVNTRTGLDDITEQQQNQVPNVNSISSPSSKFSTPNTDQLGILECSRAPTDAIRIEDGCFRWSSEIPSANAIQKPLPATLTDINLRIKKGKSSFQMMSLNYHLWHVSFMCWHVSFRVFHSCHRKRRHRKKFSSCLYTTGNDADKVSHVSVMVYELWYDKVCLYGNRPFSWVI